jgi:ribosome-binding protein aMBF1 (putative translation factor)
MQLRGEIDRVFQSSYTLCRKFESEALQVEFEKQRQRDDPKNWTAVSETNPSPSSPLEPFPPPPDTQSESEPIPNSFKETVGDQIQRLRRECNWTIERLAEKVGLDESTVKRHLAGKQTAHLSTISLYQQAFSKALKKDVFISKTP